MRALVDDAEAEIVGGLADDREIEAPLDEDRLGDLLLRGLEHHEHALLAFRQHHFIGRHLVFAHRHLVEHELDAEIALGAHFNSRAGEARSTHILDGCDTIPQQAPLDRPVGGGGVKLIGSMRCVLDLLESNVLCVWFARI